MLNIKKVAVTGGLAAGKTTVCQFFKECGATVVSADEITHKLLSPGTITAQRVVSLLGQEIISGSVIDRKKMAAIVFSQPQLLESLEKILHPAVFDEIEEHYKKAQQDPKATLFIAEIPLLYEAQKEALFDAVIVVTAREELCRSRSHIKEFDARMKRQMAPETKLSKATYAIQNNGNLEALKAQTKQIYSQLTIPFSSGEGRINQ